MTKRTEKTGGTQGANTEATALARLLAPLVDGMTTTRHQLLTWVQSAGLVALDAVFREEAAALAGPKGRHEPTRTHHHWGATPRQLTFGGRQLSLSCPRVRSREGQEAALPSVRAFREKDPLTARGVGRRARVPSVVASWPRRAPSSRPSWAAAWTELERLCVGRIAPRARQRSDTPTRRCRGNNLVNI